MNKNYPSVTDHLKLQFGDSFDEKFAELTADFRKDLLEWFQKTYKEVLVIKKDDKLRRKRIVDILNKNVSDLENIIEAHEDFKWADNWNLLIEEVIEALPETIVEYQSEDRFATQDDDSIKLKFQKKLKRTARRVGMPFKKDKKGWKQVIQLKNTAKLQLTGLSNLPDRLLSEELELQSRAIGKLLEQQPVNKEVAESKEQEDVENDQPVDDGSDSSKEESKQQSISEKPDYQFEVIEKIETHLQESIQILKSIESDPPISEQVFNVCFQAAVISGTVEEDRQLLEPDSIKNKLIEKKSSLAKQQTEWLKFFKSQFSDFAIQIEIARFAFLADKAREEILNFTHSFFRDYFYLPLEAGVTRIKEISERLKKQKSDKLPAKLVQELRDEISSKLTDELLERMRDEEEQQLIIDQIQKVITDLQLGFYNFTETFVLAEKRVIENGRPQLTTDTVSWKKLASRYVQEKALREMDPEKREWGVFVKKLSSEAEEVVQVVDVNLLTAKESEDQKDEEQPVLEIAISGADRAVKQLEAAIKQVRERQNSYEKVVKEHFLNSIHSLASKMLSRSYSELEMQDKALQVKAKAQNWQVQVKKYSYNILEKLELFRRYFAIKFKEYRKVSSRFLGFESEDAVSTTEKRNLAEYLATVNVYQKYPFVYKRIFSTDFEIDDRFYTQPSGLYTQFEQSFEDWNLNIDTNFLVVGERGSGKSLALQFIEKRYLEGEKVIFVDFHKTIYKEKDLLGILAKAFGFDQVETRDDLIQKIEKRRSRSILIVENIHNIFIRNIHGFEAIESFWIIMASTRNKLYWLTTCSTFAWNYYVKVFGADQYYSHIVRSDNLNREMLEKSILTRHKATGYELKFEPGSATQRSRTFRKIVSGEAEKQAYLQEQYFNRLDKIAEGNLSIAMIFWMQSIKEFDDKSVKQLPTEVADLDKLEVPSREVLFTLAAMVLHENLTEEELSMSLHQDISESRLMLARLKSKGIAQSTEDGYKLNHLVYRQVVRLLKRRNIIH